MNLPFAARCPPANVLQFPSLAGTSFRAARARQDGGCSGISGVQEGKSRACRKHAPAEGAAGVTHGAGLDPRRAADSRPLPESAMKANRLTVGTVTLAVSLRLLTGGQACVWAQEAAPGQGEQTRQGVFVFSRPMSGTYLATARSQTPIASVHGDYICPRLLPGQDKVLLNSRRGGGPGIWIQDVGSEERERVCDGDQVSVAPDGRYIAFRRQGVIVCRNLRSGDERVLSPAKWVSCSQPSFYPDGRVLFASTGQRRDNVCIVDPGSPGAANTLFDCETESAPRCSPDGQVVAYQNGAHICLFDMRTKAHRQVTFAGGVQSWPMWSEDGESLAYLQSPSAIDGPWHVFRVKLDEPERVSLILRNVEPGPDWDGNGFSGGVSSELKGDGVRLWGSEQPVRIVPGATALPEPGGGWTALPGNGGTTKGDLMVECEWGGLYLSASSARAFLAQRGERGLTQVAEMALLAEGASQAERVDSVSVSTLGVDRVEIAAALRSDDGRPMAATLSVFRSRPIVELKPGEHLAGALVRKSLELTVVPDRLGDDLIYGPSDHDASEVWLPWSPFVLGMASDESGLLMVVTPSPKQTVELVKPEQQDAFAGFRAQCGGESIFISFLSGGDRWHATEVRAAEEGDGWAVSWANPFPAQWRLAAQGREANLAMMARMDTPISEKNMPLEEGRVLTSAPGRAIIYAYGRSQNTALDRMMPTDILRDALGLGGASELLDIEGIRTYRHADEWVPYKDPRVGLKVISWIRTRQRPGAQEKIDDVCRDILLSLQGLDARIKEYGSFVGQVRRVSEQGSTRDRAPEVRERLRARLAELDERLQRRPVPPLDGTAAKIAEFRESANAPYMPFSSSVTAALYPRLDGLTAYRVFAKSVRRDAGLTLAASPGSRDVCERLRTLAGQVIRSRYYLEGNWLGEEPIGEPEVSYEKISDL